MRNPRRHGHLADASHGQPSHRAATSLALVPLAMYALPWLAQRGLRAILGDEAGQRFVYDQLLPELGPIEIPTMLLLLAAGVWALRLGATRVPDLGRPAATMLVAFGAGLLLVAGEEASWGQWLFGFTPPDEVARINHQGELNLHNIALQGKTELMRALFGLAGLAAVFAAPRMGAFSGLRAPVAFAPWFAAMTVFPLWELATDYVTLVPLIDGFASSKLFSEWQELMISASALAYVALLALRFPRTRRPGPDGSRMASRVAGQR